TRSFVAQNFLVLKQQPLHTFVTRARFARCVSFRWSDLRSIPSATGRKGRDPRKCDNHRHSASDACRQSKTRLDRCRDNLCPANRRDYELTQTRDARSWKFHNVRSPRLRAWTWPSRKTRHPRPCPAKVRHARGAERIRCPPRR